MGRHAWPSHRALAQRGCRVEGQGGGFAACLAVDRRHAAAMGWNQGPNWRADREGATGLDRSRLANGTTALWPSSTA